MTSLAVKTCVRMLCCDSLFRSAIHVISFHVFRAETQQVGTRISRAACEEAQQVGATREAGGCVGQRLQTELLGKFLLSLSKVLGRTVFLISKIIGVSRSRLTEVNALPG